jgi:hypothetical protein
MNNIRNLFVVMTLTAALVPATASAQQPAPATGLQISEVQSGFVIAPDARFTEVNDKAATLAGFYGGWLTDRKLLIGGGAYWLANRADDFKMQYFGGLVRWNFGADRTLGFSTGTFVGFGDATLSRTYGDVFGAPSGTAAMDRPFDGHNHGRGQAITSDTRLRINDDFVVAEPQVSALWNISGWMRLDAGVGYRFIAASDLLGDQLRGPSASISLQFGGH